jgi:hypothetical protein
MVVTTCSTSALWTDAEQTAPRRTQRTENLDRYSIVKDRRKKPTLDLCRVECPLMATDQGVQEDPPDENTPENRVVELIGIEPTTSGLQNPRSPN